ncbi:hypothetical protein NDU88_002170 [Pleurodeles waltl]|uniref:Uncharacterized protein n=1 Tax=Pleurodeles waltl TaxID=8319 RepID=A0AAV7TMB2_PLEWA|nr:hypothetical protein NDU88_002170 [Pleurodeles waltl]
MASQCLIQRRAPSRTSPARPRQRNWTPHQGRTSASAGADCGESPDEDSTQKTKSFLEQLFGVSEEDFATLKQEIATDVKDLKREVTELEQQIDTVERTHDEMDQYRWEIQALQDSNQDLQYHLEDLENRLRRSSIYIRGGTNAGANPEP